MSWLRVEAVTDEGVSAGSPTRTVGYRSVGQAGGGVIVVRKALRRVVAMSLLAFGLATTASAPPTATAAGAAGATTIRLDGMADRIALGSAHSCIILDSGGVTCWGSSLHGQLGYGNTNNIGDDETPAANPVNGGIVPLPGGQTADALASGALHTCALLAHGPISCWGSGSGGKLGYGNTDTIGDFVTPFTNPVNGGIIRLPGAQTTTAITTGSAHTCALLAHGAITCWGSGGFGALGYGNSNGNIGDNETPATNPVNGGIIPLPGGQTATAIAAGSQHTCALLANGRVTCWGLGSTGRLGYGNTNDIGDNETPATNPVDGGLVALPGGRTATAITAGSGHTCALLSDGAVTCWGASDLGVLGYGNSNSIGDDETPATNPVNGGLVAMPGGQTATSITAGDFHTCALLADGTITCWGYGIGGRLGYGNSNDIGDNETPGTNPVNGGIVDMPGIQAVTAISAGSSHTCALFVDGTVTCWGMGNSGRLGYGNLNDIGDNETPATNPVNGGIVDLPGSHAVTALAGGGFHTCALFTDGTVTCWGLGSVGRLGYGNENTIGDNENPAGNPVNGGIVQLPDNQPAAAISGGTAHSCAILTDRRITCWGISNFGQLGYGTTSTIGDDETPAANPVNGGIVPLPNHLFAIDYRALTPSRLLDTRPTGATIDDLFEAGGQRPAGSVLQLDVAGRGGVAADATSITLSVAAVQPTAGGFLTIWPCAAAQPNASSLNYAAGVNTANTVITGIDGGVCIYTSQATQLIADVVGYTPRSSTLTSLTPARYVDTRPTGSTFDDQFEAGGQRPAASTLNVDIADRGAVPAGTRTVILNVAAVQPTTNGFLTIWPCDATQPNASNLNYVSGTNTANLVIARAATDGTVCIYTSQATQLIVDVVGYF
ncbi:MAG TPA: hypothetical protein DCR14_12005, partial [Acidimicrobiaceae bacterium]|nr:hypothetical protein [Acidimicrobiaceae bacterium]